MDIVYMGSPDFSVPSLEQLVESDILNVKGVITRPDKPRGRGQKKQSTPIKKKALQLGCQVFTPENVNSSSFINQLQELAPEIIVVVAFGQILSRKVLETPDRGCVNLHASLLPKYRGASPIHRAIMNGEEKTGVTVMFMEETLDTGDIISQKEVVINRDDTAGDLHDRLAETGAKLLVRTLIDIKQNNYTRKQQNDQEASYADKLDNRAGEIDWNCSAEDIYNFVRGLNPWPVAYTFWDDMRLKIWQVNIKDKNSKKGEPGEILQVSGEGLVVQTGCGIIELEKLQPAGKKKMDCVDFVNGYELEPGTVLG